MKFFFLHILILCSLAACGSPSKQRSKYRSHNANYKNFQRTSSKFVNRVRPSESMQVGSANGNSYALKNSEIKKTVESNPEGTADGAVKTAQFRQDNSLALYSEEDVQNDDIKGAVADTENYKGIFKIGNPYEIFGVSYIPQDYDDYEEIGMASWYGDDFHGKQTANGEIYDMGSLTAAHRTLPLPSLVRVTNLQNGKTVVVRVNDRGPYAKNRIIDVSEKAANILGFKGRGTTQVKIELLRNDTDEMLKRLKIKN